MKKDVIVVGELNVDLILQGMPSFPELGKEKLAENMTLTMGSASAIFATNIARLDLSVGFIGKLGKDNFAGVVLDTLKSRNVDTSAIIQDENSKTGITVALTFPNDYAMITYMGAMQSFTLEEINLDSLDDYKHLHFASYYLQPGMRPGVAELFRMAKGKGLTTSFDPGWDPSEKWDRDIYSVLKYTDIFLPNEQEAHNISSCTSIEDAARYLSRYAKITVVKCGSKGAVCSAQEGELIKTKVFTVKPVDTTGAGDSFNSGFLYGFINNNDLRTSLRFGSACGALATTKMGGTTASPSAGELKKFLSEHEEENIFLN